MVLTNQELYLYSKKDSTKHQKLIILSPGVFVRSLPPQTVERSSNKDAKNPKIYPIELSIGGNIANIGIEPVILSQGNQNGIITLFFEDQEVHHKWTKFFEEATGNYNIKDYYTFNSKTSISKRKSRPIDPTVDLEDEDLQAGEEHGNSTKPSCYKLINGEKYSNILGIGSNGSVIVEGVQKSTKR